MRKFLSIQSNPVSGRLRKLERELSRLRYWPWFLGKQFTSNWASQHFTLWRRVLSPLRKKPLRILEIGSWEGRSALFFVNFFRRSTITCIDTFEGGSEVYAKWKDQLSGIEARFDHNLAPFGSRVEKLRLPSRVALDRLTEQGRRYDLAYIDGSHDHDDVLADSVGTWSLLAPGGIIIWDDYQWGTHLPADQRPKAAIDAFLSEHDGSYRLLACSAQVIIEKQTQ